jgi:hypothetical protein
MARTRHDPERAAGRGSGEVLSPPLRHHRVATATHNEHRGPHLGDRVPAPAGSPLRPKPGRSGTSTRNRLASSCAAGSCTSPAALRPCTIRSGCARGGPAVTACCLAGHDEPLPRLRQPRSPGRPSRRCSMPLTPATISTSPPTARSARGGGGHRCGQEWARCPVRSTSWAASATPCGTRKGPAGRRGQAGRAHPDAERGPSEPRPAPAPAMCKPRTGRTALRNGVSRHVEPPSKEAHAGVVSASSPDPPRTHRSIGAVRHVRHSRWYRRER